MACSGARRSTVTVTTGPPTLLHVGDLDGKTTVNTSTRYTINITVTVHNAAHGVVSGVTVTGNWSGGTTGGVSCKTTTAGTCVLAKGNILRTGGPVTLTIAGLALSPIGVYQPVGEPRPRSRQQRDGHRRHGAVAHDSERSNSAASAAGSVTGRRQAKSRQT